MINFKTYLKIRYPEWENEKHESLHERLNHNKMIRNEQSCSGFHDVLLSYYNDFLLSSIINSN